MESKAKYAYVGAIIIAITVMIIVFVLWLAEVGSLRHSRYYTIYFRNHALYGLQVDSYVTMKGIKVGSVKSLEISPKNIEQVRVVLVLNEDAPVIVDTVAVINRNLLTGFASLDLARGKQESPELTAVQAGEKYPIIPEAKTELEQITDSLPALADKIGQVTGRIDALLSTENIESFTKTLQNVETFTTTLASNKDKFDSMFKTLDQAANEFGKISKTLDEFAVANDRRLAELSTEFVSSMRELRETIVQFRSQSSEMMTSLAGASQVLSQQMTAMAQNINETAQSASTAFQAFEQPRTLITGPAKGALGPGEGASK